MTYYQVTPKVRECTKQYLLYLAYTTIKIKEGGYKEENTYIPFTFYEIFESDSLDEIREHRDNLFSILDPINSYTSIIVDKTNQKFVQKLNKYIGLNEVCEYFQIESKKEINKIKLDCRITEKRKLLPSLHFGLFDYTCNDYNKFNKLSELDFFFRGPSEIPKDYVWDEGEYIGWLQFRWGDGENAISKE